MHCIFRNFVWHWHNGMQSFQKERLNFNLIKNYCKIQSFSRSWSNNRSPHSNADVAENENAFRFNGRKWKNKVFIQIAFSKASSIAGNCSVDSILIWFFSTSSNANLIKHKLMHGRSKARYGGWGMVWMWYLWMSSGYATRE